MKLKLKKIFCVFIILFMVISTSGCVKYNANMDIKKNKSMDFSIIYALDTTVFGDEEMLKEKDIKELKNLGYKVEEYIDGNMKGYKFSISVANIDFLSGTEDVSFHLSEMLSDKENTKNLKLFKLEKGIFKNKYIADFKFDSNDSDVDDESVQDRIQNKVEEAENEDIVSNDVSENNNLEQSTISSIDNNVNQVPTEDVIIKDENISSIPSVDDEEENSNRNDDSLVAETEKFIMQDYRVMKIVDDEYDDLTDDTIDTDFNFDNSSFKNLDLSFNVTLPFSAVSNNATKTSNDNKNLTWSLVANEENSIEFSFELYNYINIICISIAILIIVIIVGVIVVRKLKKKKNAVSTNSNPMQNDIMSNNIVSNLSDNNSQSSSEIGITNVNSGIDNNMNHNSMSNLSDNNSQSNSEIAITNDTAVVNSMVNNNLGSDNSVVDSTNLDVPVLDMNSVTTISEDSLEEKK